MDRMLKKVKEMGDEERDRLRQLLKEQKSEKDSSKMNWMYSEGRPETEDYLLGRRIDKYIDDEKDKEKEAMKDAPGASFMEVIAKRSDLDMQTKMREDPLYAIRKKEEEARRRLLENPIRMKQLQKKLKQKAEEEKKRKKKKKKEKKRKKRQGDSDSDSGEDNDLINKYLAILEQKKQKRQEGAENEKNAKHESHHSSSEGKKRHKRRQSSSSSTDEVSHPQGKGSRSEVDADLIDEIQKCLGASTEDSDDDDERDGQKKAYGLLVKAGQERLPVHRKESNSPLRSFKKSRSRSPNRSRKSRSRSRSPKKSSRRSKSPRLKRSRSRSPRRRRSRSPARRRSRSPARRRSRSPARRRSPRSSPPRKNPPKKKLSAEEMERRRQEMMEDAVVRDDQRAANLERHRKEQLAESEQLKNQLGKDADFISPIMSKHAEASSVEDRLKRNRHNIQRTKVQLDKSFTRH